jgi:CPA2 family monovalent cation:H+ antiporter-2/glutathione-regulated potassium-efflux system protein KefB
MTSAAEAAQATTAILESSAIMLGAALIFVTLFRRLKRPSAISLPVP